MTVIHNAANKRTQITTADGGLTTYAYDDIYQLTEEHRTGPSPYRHTYAYDSVQNRTVKVIDGVRTTSTFDAANQLQVELTGADRTTYTFDNNGNEILKQEPSSDRTTTTYDFENQANAIVLPTNVRNTMSYNPDQLRVKLEDSSGTTKYVWDGASYLFELDGTNTTKAVFTQEPGSYGGLNSQYRYNGSLWLPSYYHSDSLGNTTALTDDTEDITDTYQYDAFGNVLSHTGSTVNPFQFGGSWGYCTDPDTGHVYIRARIYIPRQGRWTSVDILLFVNGPNVYAAYFVPNGIDPSGLQGIFGIQPIITVPRHTLLPGTTVGTFHGLRTHLEKSCCATQCGEEKVKCERELTSIMLELENARQKINQRGTSYLSYFGNVCTDCEDQVRLNLHLGGSSNFDYRTVIYNTSAPVGDHVWGELTCKKTGDVAATIDLWGSPAKPWASGPDGFRWTANQGR